MRRTSQDERIPLSRVEIDDEIRERVRAALDSGRYILGPECQAFERELAAWFGCEQAVLVSSATAALMLGLLSLGVGEGDEVLVPSHTAFPTVEAVFQTGATPVFVDTDASATLDPEALEPLVTARTKVILPVHLFGQACDLDPILAVARRHGLEVLEDCAQAHGAAYRGRRVGSFGRAAALSFYPSKNLTVFGDGGALLTSDRGIAEQVRMLRDHGRRSKFTHDVVGWNLRFNELQAAAGRVLLRRLDALNGARRRIAARYRELLADLPLRLPEERKYAHHVYHLFVVRTERRDALAAFLGERGIETGIHYPVPCHLQPATLGRRVRAAALPETERAAREILSLPLYPSLPDAGVVRVAEAVRAFFAQPG